MQWPHFDAAGLGSMVITGVISFVVAWATTLIVNRIDTNRQRVAWRRERLIEDGKSIRDQINELKQRHPPTFEESKKAYYEFVQANPEWERPIIEKNVKKRRDTSITVNIDEDMNEKIKEYEATSVRMLFGFEDPQTPEEYQKEQEDYELEARNENIKVFHWFYLERFPFKQDESLKDLNKRLRKIEEEINSFHQGEK